MARLLFLGKEGSVSRVDVLLSRLDKVCKSGSDSWIACCPAHDDSMPSLSIRETDDGIVLLHCFSGACSAPEIVAAIGMEISDLFPPRQHHGKSKRRPFPAMDALRALAYESLIVTAAGSTMLTSQPLSKTDSQRLSLAVSRFQGALSAVAPQLHGGCRG